jgi:hypothetical protein
LGDPLVLQLGDDATAVADQELAGVGPPRVGAAHEGVEAFDLVHEPLLQQEVQGPIHGRRGQRTGTLTHGVQNLVGADGPSGLPEDREYPPALLCEPDPALRAQGLGVG